MVVILEVILLVIQIVHQEVIQVAQTKIIAEVLFIQNVRIVTAQVDADIVMVEEQVFLQDILRRVSSVMAPANVRFAMVEANCKLNAYLLWLRN